MNTSISSTFVSVYCFTDANFDLPGCLESLSDMAQTGKTSSFRKSSTTSRALWGMSRALSAPVATHDYLSQRPSLERTKAVSLDTYSPNINDTDDASKQDEGARSAPIIWRTFSHKGIFSSCVKGGLSTIDAEDDSDDTFPPPQSHMIPGSSYVSPAIEVSPPETEASYLLKQEEKSKKGNVSGRSPSSNDTAKTSPRDTTNRLQVPSKHTLLQEKRKKFLRKSSPVEEDQVEEGRLLKELSQVEYEILILSVPYLSPFPVFECYLLTDIRNYNSLMVFFHMSANHHIP